MAATLAALNLKLKGTPWLHETTALVYGPSLHECQEILSLPPFRSQIYTAVFQGLRSAASHALSGFIALLCMPSCVSYSVMVESEIDIQS